MEVNSSQRVEQSSGLKSFDSLEIGQCHIHMLRVQLSDKRIYEIQCLKTSSGKAYLLNHVLQTTIFGHVCHATLLTYSLSTGHYTVTNPPINVAIKVYQSSKVKEWEGKTQENLFTEIAVLQTISSEDQSNSHVVQFHECCYDGDSYYTILEYLDADLFSIVLSSNGLDEGQAREYFKQIVQGVKYLQSLNIAHRDISLENIMVNRNGECKIIDLGAAMVVARNSDGTTIPVIAQGICGKKNYIAPEVIGNYPFFDPLKVDIWSMGVTLFVMVTGLFPLDLASDLDEKYRVISSGRLNHLVESWNLSISSELVDLISKILRPDPTERLSIDDILNHPWMHRHDYAPHVQDHKFGMRVSRLNNKGITVNTTV